MKKLQKIQIAGLMGLGFVGIVIFSVFYTENLLQKVLTFGAGCFTLSGIGFIYMVSVKPDVPKKIRIALILHGCKISVIGLTGIIMLQIKDSNILPLVMICLILGFWLAHIFLVFSHKNKQ